MAVMSHNDMQLACLMGFKCYDEDVLICISSFLCRPSGWDSEKKISILYDQLKSFSPTDAYESVIQPPKTTGVSCIGKEGLCCVSVSVCMCVQVCCAFCVCVCVCVVCVYCVCCVCVLCVCVVCVKSSPEVMILLCIKVYVHMLRAVFKSIQGRGCGGA